MRAATLPAVAALALAMAGCAVPDYPTTVAATSPTSPQAPPPAPEAPARPPPVAQAAPTPRLATPIPRPEPAASDSCGAANMQGMIGRSRTLIPVPVDPSRQRVACTTCKLSDDVDPGRLNFLFNAHTGLIEQVRCG
ncbi:peptidase inhibitor I78 [Phenylobacterium sp.]|uniref:peptidase inhibitor I78 n=1 Tax=Phenylobacterium sp. TaxID=1871053 RepID=UPI002F405E2D